MLKMRYFIIIIIATLVSISQIYATAASDDPTGRDETHVYHLTPQLLLVSIYTMEHLEPSMMIKMVYPELQDHRGSKTISGFNQLVMQQMQNSIRQFKNAVASLSTPKVLRKKTNQLYLDYNAVYMPLHQQGILSIRFSKTEMFFCWRCSAIDRFFIWQMSF